MVNAFPTIMTCVFRKVGLRTPFLDDYVSRQEELLEELCSPSFPRDRVKTLFLVSLHGGDYRHKSKCLLTFLEQFQNEIRTCTRLLLEDARYVRFKTLALAPGTHTNVHGRAIALLCQDVESKINAWEDRFHGAMSPQSVNGFV